MKKSPTTIPVQKASAISGLTERPNWASWAAKSYWSVDEGAALICAVEPTFVHQLSEENLGIVRTIKQAIVIAIEREVLPPVIRPPQLVDLFERVSEWGVPPELKIAVLRYADDPQRSYQLLAAECEKLKKENAQLKLEVKRLDPLDAREKQTLCQLVITMAVEHYGFSKERRNDATSSIIRMMEKYGISRKYDAVHRHLVDAADEYLPGA